MRPSAPSHAARLPDPGVARPFSRRSHPCPVPSRRGGTRSGSRAATGRCQAFRQRHCPMAAYPDCASANWWRRRGLGDGGDHGRGEGSGNGDSRDAGKPGRAPARAVMQPAEVPRCRLPIPSCGARRRRLGTARFSTSLQTGICAPWPPNTALS